jgi:hypothetical protein
MYRAAQLLRDWPAAVSPPGLAEALEIWLEQAAAAAEKSVSKTTVGWWCHKCGDQLAPCCPHWNGALATARAILGEADHG